ncbi:hypothetical protein Q669_29715 [Labrenzia sp. C1B10]|uniref:VRR-NUC domain-containing protein n=1 Tax=unclassified Labrenzia TaxID=2648686 RepID=UPI0003B89165|nr:MULTISPECIES: VRR-NUC domain-containing protein [unclassified Labrenzia]ERP95653.1 hypothetical protein Q669_29715 [Labrenzia sp. C1B10]ERS05719.1 hypothetical protein Q675_29280 [Labrenzia sp. C1B70]
MLEKKIERLVSAYGEKRGFLVRKLQWVGRHGAPDRVFMKAGVIYFIEFKQKGKKPTANQEAEIQRLRDAGFGVWVIDCVEEGKALLDRLSGRNSRDHEGLI